MIPDEYTDHTSHRQSEYFKCKQYPQYASDVQFNTHNMYTMYESGTRTGTAQLAYEIYERLLFIAARTASSATERDILNAAYTGCNLKYQ